MDEKSEAVVHFYDQAPDGPGHYYYCIADYPDKGCVGSFETKEKAIKHAEKSGFFVASYESVEDDRNLQWSQWP